MLSSALARPIAQSTPAVGFPNVGFAQPDGNRIPSSPYPKSPKLPGSHRLPPDSPPAVATRAEQSLPPMAPVEHRRAASEIRA